MALTDQTFVIETVAATGADHASLASFASSFNGGFRDLVTDGNVAVAMVDSFVDTGGQAEFSSWTTDSDNIIIVSVPLALPLDTGAGTFTQGETITGGTSGATAMVIDQGATYHGVGGTNSLIVSFLGGVFEDGETVTGGTSAATGTVNGSLDKSLYHGGVSRDVNGGTGYQIDGQDSVSFGVIRLTGGAEYARFFGIEVKRGASGGIRQAGQSVKNENDVQQYWNCISHDNSGDGFNVNTTEILLVNCLSYANTSEGFLGTTSGNQAAAYFCTAYGNGAEGFQAAGRREMRNCVSGGNTGDDFAFETSMDYCLSSDASAGGANSKTNITFTADTAVTGAIFTNLTAGSEDFTPQAATGGATQELEDAGVAVAAYGADIALGERSDPPDLGAFEIAAAAGGTDALTVGDLTGSAPSLNAPTLSQTHAFAVGDIAASAPTLDTPTLGQIHALAAGDVAASAPTLDSQALGQTHALTGADIATSAPTLDQPAIGQVHALATADLATAAPVLDTPTLGTEGEDALAAGDLTGATPTLGTPTLGQVHALATSDAAAATPALDNPTLGTFGEDALVAGDLTAAAPVLDAPSIGQAHSLATDGLDTGLPILVSPTLGQIHSLAVAHLVANAPILATPTLVPPDVLDTTTPGGQIAVEVHAALAEAGEALSGANGDDIARQVRDALREAEEALN